MTIAGIEFRPVKGFENYYEVSADGAIFSKITNWFRTQTLNKNGYAYITLCDPTTKRKQTKTVHRIVAEAWLGTEPQECINHKNENKLDNHADNLEWCSRAYNNTYNGKTQRCCKPVIGTNIENGAVIEFSGAREAAKVTGAEFKNISAVCHGLRKSAGGFTWKFKKEG